MKAGRDLQRNRIPNRDRCFLPRQLARIQDLVTLLYCPSDLSKLVLLKNAGSKKRQEHHDDRKDDHQLNKGEPLLPLHHIPGLMVTRGT